MYEIKASIATTENPDLHRVMRDLEQPEDNLTWVSQRLEDIDAPPDAASETFVFLFGGRTAADFRLRVAQAHLRDDLTPSHWSHVAIAEELGDPIGTTRLLECSLEPPGGFRGTAQWNAVQTNTLDWYADPQNVPNIALVVVPVPPARWNKPIEVEVPSEATGPENLTQTSIREQFERQRAVVDMPELLLRWLGFVWGVGKSGNPLLDGAGIPSAVMAEFLLTGAGFDITPGLDSRASTPETLWQTAKWWHMYFAIRDRQGLRGAYTIEDRLYIRERDDPNNQNPNR